jgi:hypothetical protein
MMTTSEYEKTFVERIHDRGIAEGELRTDKPPVCTPDNEPPGVVPGQPPSRRVATPTGPSSAAAAARVVYGGVARKP